MYIELSGYQREKLSEALRGAFPTPAKIKEFLSYKFNKNLYDITIAESLQELALDLIREAESKGWVKTLIIGARQSNPGNQKLINFCEDFCPDILFPNISLPPELLKRDSREKILREANSFLDPSIWGKKFSEIQVQVCRIEFPKGQAQGTGFLIAPNVVITNFHVMEDVINRNAAYSDVILRFDYQNLRDNEPSEGTEYYLSEKWLIDQSPYLKNNKNGLPTIDELDYALLRVDGEPGNNTIGEPGSPIRGWIKLPTKPDNFSPNTPLFILQHPNGKPLKLALDTDGIIDVNENGTRVRYKTNTEPGSSGSPCFNSNWDLVALHHMGIKGEYNAGTPFIAICRRLKKQRLKEQSLLDALQNGQAI